MTIEFLEPRGVSHLPSLHQHYVSVGKTASLFFQHRIDHALNLGLPAHFRTRIQQQEELNPPLPLAQPSWLFSAQYQAQKNINSRDPQESQ